MEMLKLLMFGNLIILVKLAFSEFSDLRNDLKVF
jgi:hypothetical protein